MATELQSLKSNPIFQLSLASKELFHSNFLYWLSQDEKLKGLFQKVISSLCDNKIIWNDLGDYVVLREYKNFDLCICKKKSTQTNNSSSAVGNGKGDNNNSTDEYQSKMGVDADGDEYEDNNSSNEDKTVACDPNYDDIQQAGEIVFVLENKFKSIATAAQLRKYVEKTLEYNVPILRNRVVSNKGRSRWQPSYSSDLRVEIKKCKPKFVLLTLAKKFAEKDAINKIGDETFGCNQNGVKIIVDSKKEEDNKFCSKGNKWIIRTYEDYAQFLINSLLDNNDEKLSTFNVSYQIIFNYIRFIRTFSLEINKHLGEIGLKKNWNAIFDYHDQFFKSIRCSDIWQKMAMHKIAQELMKKEGIQELINSQGFVIDTDSSDKHCRECSSKDNYDKTIFIGVQYFHSLALLEMKYRIDDDCMFVIQQQGNSLCAGIDYLNTKPEKPEEDFLSTYIVKDSNIIIDKNPHSYKNDKGVFFYQNIILKSQSKDGPTIEETINFMVKCLINVINPSTGNSNDTVALKDKESGSLK